MLKALLLFVFSLVYLIDRLFLKVRPILNLTLQTLLVWKSLYRAIYYSLFWRETGARLMAGRKDLNNKRQTGTASIYNKFRIQVWQNIEQAPSRVTWTHKHTLSNHWDDLYHCLTQWLCVKDATQHYLILYFINQLPSKHFPPSVRVFDVTKNRFVRDRNTVSWGIKPSLIFTTHNFQSNDSQQRETEGSFFWLVDFGSNLQTLTVTRIY